MEDTQDKDIAVIRNDIDWIKKTISEKFKELGTQLDGIPLAIDSLSKRIDTNDRRISSAETGLLEHVKYGEVLEREHKVNTDFRKQSMFLIGLFKWLVPGNLLLSAVLAILYFFKDSL